MIYPIGGCSTHPIIHVAGAVAGAVADTDETYGAQAAAEKNTFTNTNNSANNANYANYANYTYYGPPKLYSIAVAFQNKKESCTVQHLLFNSNNKLYT